MWGPPEPQPDNGSSRSGNDIVGLVVSAVLGACVCTIALAATAALVRWLL